jgi:hypothetical protein
MITKIYLVENCYNDPNKVYIGKTKNFNGKRKNSRKNAHTRTYGEYIIYNYIDEVNSVKRKDWKLLETYWIEQFRAWGFEVLNKNNGGGGLSYQTEETIEKIRNKLIGKSKPPRTKEHSSKLSVSSMGVKRSGSGRKKGAKDKIPNSEARRVKKRKHPEEANKRRAEKNRGQKRTQETKNKQSLAKLGKPGSRIKPVFQYDKNNNLIKKWNSNQEAADALGIRRHGIVTCCLGGTKTYKGYIWKYY